MPIEVLSGNLGTQVVTAGTATAVTAIDLTGVCQDDDIAVITVRATDTRSSGGNTFRFYKDSGGTEILFEFLQMSTSTTIGAQRTLQKTFLHRIGSPSASLYYNYFLAPVGGSCDVWVQMNIRGIADV